MTREHGGGFEAGCLEHVGKTHAGPFGATNAAIGPLVTACLRGEKRAAIAAAFQHHSLRHRPELRLQLGQRELELLIHLAVDDDLPVIGILRRLRYLSVIADEELVDRRRIVVEQVFRRLSDQRALAKHDQLVALAGKIEILRPFGGRGGRLRERGWDQSPWHPIGERNSAADRRTYRGEAASAQEATAVDRSPAAQNDRIGSFLIVVVKFFNLALYPARHPRLP